MSINISHSDTALTSCRKPVTAYKLRFFLVISRCLWWQMAIQAQSNW